MGMVEENGEGAASRCIPINTYVFLFKSIREKPPSIDRTAYPRGGNDIGIPGAVGHLDVFYAMFLFCRLAEDVAVVESSVAWIQFLGRQQTDI